MTSSPLISIITIVKDDASGLDDTLASIEKQQYRGIESIVIDGASTDGTQGIIQKHAAIIRFWSSEPDHGIYDAMNKGLRQVKGDLVLFLNAGDLLHSVNTLDEFFQNCYQADNKNALYLCSVITDKAERKGPKHLWLKKHYMLPTCHQGIIYPAEIFRNKQFSEKYRISSDVHHYLSIRDQVNIIECNLTLSIYDTNGISSTNTSTRDREYHQIYQELEVPVIFRILKRLHELHDRIKR